MRIRLSTARRWGRRKKRLKQKAKSLADPSAYTGIAADPPPRRALAAAGLALSAVGFVFWPAAVPGVLCGHAALSRTAGRQQPRRLALAAALAGWGALALHAALALAG